MCYVFTDEFLLPYRTPCCSANVTFDRLANAVLRIDTTVKAAERM
jgi:hypothetical protein